MSVQLVANIVRKGGVTGVTQTPTAEGEDLIDAARRLQPDSA